MGGEQLGYRNVQVVSYLFVLLLFLSEGLDIIPIMSITIKVLLGEKLYKMSPGAHTLQQVDREMRQRFPNLPTLNYSFAQQVVTDIANIVELLRRQGQNSLKLEAKFQNQRAQEEKKEAQSFEIQHLKEQISLIKENSIKSISDNATEKKEDLPAEFYVCYQCTGKGQVSEGSFMHLCSICKGVGKLQHSHKYVQRLRQLFLKEQKVEEKENEKVLAELKEEEPVRKSSYAVDKSYEVIVSQINKKDRVETNKLFTMRFQIKNIGQDWDHKNIYVIESGKKDGKRVSALKNGGKMVIELGPFVCKSENVLEKTFSLFYQEGDQLVRFGHKFGFSVRGAKKMEIRKNDTLERQRERVRDLKAISGSCKSEEYLMLKLKSLGIDLLNWGMDDEVILDIVKQIK